MPTTPRHCTPPIATLAIAVIAATTASGHAAEPVFRDLNLSVEIQPVDFEFELTAADGNKTTGDDEFDTLVGVSFGWRHSFVPAGWRHGPMVGVHITGMYGEYDLDSTYQSIGARVTTAWVMSITDSLMIAAAPYAEYGVGTWEFPENAVFDGFTADGDYVAYGANAHLLYAITDHIQLDFSVGYRLRDQELTGGGATFNVENNGPMALLGISYRFSASPTRLE